MAKDKKTDDIIDELAENVGAGEGEGAPSGDGGESVVPGRVAGAGKHRRKFNAWPVDKDHESVTDLLMNSGGDPDAQMGDDLADGDVVKRGSGLNLVLFILLLGAIGGGGYVLQQVSSDEALAAKMEAKKRAEEAHLKEQLAKQKKYGVLRVETNPPGALIWKNGEQIVNKNPETGEEKPGTTPVNMLNVDIGEVYEFKIELAGYETYEFAVAEHIWAKDSTTDEYKFAKMIDLVPINCEYYFVYDAKKRKEQKFEDRATCLTYYDEQVAAGGSVTDCTCKVPPEGVNPEGVPGEKKDEKKK